ncbi:reverse transcriptase domain-containing protein [Tanacetum coccineum]
MVLLDNQVFSPKSVLDDKAFEDSSNDSDFDLESYINDGEDNGDNVVVPQTLIIMEYLVKISKKARILELKRRHLKILTLTSYTPLKKEKEEAQQKRFLENLKQLHINLPFIEALTKMAKYAKFLKGLLTNKARLEEACTITMKERCLAVLLNKLPSKEKEPGSFTILYDIGKLHIDNALADLGASISLMPYTMYEKLGLGEPKPTRKSLELADRSIQYPRGIIKNVLIKVDKFVLPIDFVILDMPEDSRVPIILGKPFLATARAMIDVFNKKITLRVGDDEVIFDVDQSIKRPPDEGNKSDDASDLEKPIRRIDFLNTPYPVAQETTKPNGVKSEHLYSASASEIDEKKSELKSLPHHLEYAYSHGDKSFPIVISSELSEKEKMLLLQVLEKRFFQIPIAPKDQEKTTFTCPYGTFAYKRMPFGLCNEPATFQRCTTAIFHDMVEDFMEVFMDDFSVFGHKISRAGIEVDRAKIDVIAKLLYPTNVKGVRNAKFDFSDDCKKTFNILKEKLTTTPIIISPDWNVPFELMCDTSDFAVGAVLGQRIDGKFKPIYYASKTLNNAQEHYTTTEKELLAVVFSFDKLENPDLGAFTNEEITDEFLDEQLMMLTAKPDDDEPWYADYVNYIVGKIVPPSASITRRKVYESRFFWPSIFKDAKDYIMRCDACQRSGNISSRSEMPQNNIQVEAQALPTNDARVVI